MSRPLSVHINLSALRENYRRAKQLHGGHALAVIKANAYGHGAVACAQALANEADGFAVASLEEAQTLRAAGISQPILLIEGVFDEQELTQVAALDLWIVVHSEYQLAWLETAPIGEFTVWLKMNSGMNRVGFTPNEFATAHARLSRSPRVKRLVLMSHFARADETDLTPAHQQWQTFDRITAPLSGERSICNSAALLALKEAHADWARPGIILYGCSPFDTPCPDFTPVMTVTSRIIAIQHLQRGDAVGYGGNFVATDNMRIGIVACGYADGYPRSAPSGTPIAVEKQRTRLVGRVSMDMLTVDLSALPDAKIGSEVELWGETVHVHEVATAAGTIAYELLCNMKRGAFYWDDTPHR